MRRTTEVRFSDSKKDRDEGQVYACWILVLAGCFWEFSVLVLVLEWDCEVVG